MTTDSNVSSSLDRSPTVEDRVRLTRRPIGEPVVMRQDWQHLLFLHWRVAPELVQELLPPGLTVDTFDGDAYIGLVPFTMRNVRPIWSPAVPGLSHFHETNVRTYVHVNGEPGVWFFSLDAANPVAVAIARALFHLPYYFASMGLDATQPDGSIAYRSRRYGSVGGQVTSTTSCKPSGTIRTAVPGSLDHFLCERYLLYSRKNNQLYSGRVYHTAYPLQEASVECVDVLVDAAGFPGATRTPPVHVAYARGISVEVFGLRPVIK